MRVLHLEWKWLFGGENAMAMVVLPWIFKVIV